MAVTQSQLDATQTLYIAYYGRAADPGGLAYWAGRLAEEGAQAIVNAFGFSQEFQDNYGNLSPEELVDGLFLQLFGRSADPGGLAFYVDWVERGIASLADIALRIIDGIVPGGGDDLIVANRLQVANYVTNLASGSELRNTILDSVTAAAGSIEAALAQLGISEQLRERFDLSIEQEDSKVGLGPSLGDGVGASSTGPQSGDLIGPASLESGDLIELDELRADPRFSNIDGSGYTVVVLDTGIDLDHPAFGPDANGDGVSDRIIFHRDFSEAGDGTANDVQGHGSNVASIVGSSAAGYPGVAPGVNIIALQVLDNSGSGTGEGIQRALQWVIDNHSAFDVVAVNLSLGDSRNANSPVNGYAADEFAALEALGIISVAAAGNDYFSYQTPGVSYPAADPNVIAVGATFDGSYGQLQWGDGGTAFNPVADEITPFSQRSSLLTPIFAPGAIITGAAPGGGTEGQTGTSQAAPHIAGIAALAQQIADTYLGRRLTPDEFVSLLANSADLIVDSESQDDNVVNTGSQYNRVDVLALAEAIVALGGGTDPLPQPGPGDDIPGDRSTTVTLAIGSAVEGEIDTRGDIDWYRVDLVAGQTYSFAMNGLTLADPWLAVHGPDGARLDYNNDAAGSPNAALTFTASTSGAHYLSAEAFATAQTGTFLIEARLAPVAYNDGIAGDSSTTQALASGESLASSVDFGGDEDWLKLSLQAGVTYTFAVSGAPSGAGTLADPLLEIYDASSMQVAVNDDGGLGLESLLNFTPTSSGTYFANVRAFGAGDTGSYVIDMSGEAVAGDTIPGDLSTLEILAPDGDISSRIDFANDEDWFAISVTAGTYVFDLNGSGDQPLADPYLALYGAGGSLLQVDDDSGSGLNSRLVLETGSGGTFYIAASAFGAGLGGYRLTVSAGAAGPGDSIDGVGIGDAGDTAGGAAIVTLDSNGDATVTGSTGYSGDVQDVYQFVAPASGLASFALDGLAADLDLVLQDATGTVLGGSYSGGSESESLGVLLEAGATYTLRVDPYRSAASSYSLSIDTVATTGSGRQETINGIAVGEVAADTAGAVSLPGSGNVAITGSTGFGSDAGDLFLLTAAGDGVATFSLNGLSADLDFALLGPGGAQLAGSYNGGADDEWFDFPVLADETYFLYVYPFAGASSYQLDVQLPGAFFLGGDIVNDEPIGDAGNSAGLATTVSPSLFGDAFIVGDVGRSGDSGDFYGFTAPADGVVNIELFGLSDDLDLALLDASGTEVAVSAFADLDVEFLSYTVTAGQNYTVWVDPYDSAASAYALYLDFPVLLTDGVDVISGLDLLSADAGNSLSEAQIVVPNELGFISVAGSTGFGEDVADFLTFDILADGELNISLSELGADLDLQLFDASGNLVGFSEEGGTGGESLTLDVLAGERFTVQVLPFSDAASEYLLFIDTPPLPSSSDIVNGEDIGDAGNTAETAHQVATEFFGDAFVQGSTGAAGDLADYFRVTAALDGILEIELYGIFADLDLYLLDDAGNLLASSPTSGIEEEYITYEATAGESYTVWVDPFEEGQTDYILYLDMPGDTIYGLLPWSGEIGNSLAEAPIVAPDEDGDISVEGSVGYGDDTADIIAFDIFADGELSLFLTELDGDLDLTLLDASGDIVLVSAEEGTTDEELTVSVLAGESYAVVVEPFAGAASQYSLYVDAPVPELPPSDNDEYVFGVQVGDVGDFSDPYLAPNLLFGDLVVLGGIGFGGEAGSDFADAFTYTAGEAGLLDITLYGVDAGADLDLYIYNGDGETLSVTDSTDGFAFQSLPVDAGDEFIIEVYAESGESFYGLSIFGPPITTELPYNPGDLII